MRGVTLLVFFCLAACGGGVSTPNSDVAPVPQRSLPSDAREVIATYAAQGYSQNAIDSCVAAWVDDGGGPSKPNEPIYKPDVAGFRAFLRECLGG
jgi:hypothetical protein